MIARKDGSVKRRTANLSLAMQQGRSFGEDQAAEISNRIGDKDQSEGHQPSVLCGSIGG
jgi:hypothetical protein